MDQNPSWRPQMTDPSPEELLGRLDGLRREVADSKLDYYIVPSEDEHQSEYVATTEMRRAWISGFTGSAGVAIVPARRDEKALLFVDSRYWIQAEQQAPAAGWQVQRVGSGGKPGGQAAADGWASWVVEHAPESSRVGIDPKLIASRQAKSVFAQLEDRDSSTKLIGMTKNLVDQVNPPAPRPLGPIVPHPIEFAGETASSKLKRIRSVLSSHVSGSTKWIYVLPTLPAIAWLLNYRCPDDIPHSPVAFAYFVLTQDSAAIFVDDRKTEEVEDAFAADDVELRKYGVEEVGKYVKESAESFRRDDEKAKVKVWAPAECSWALETACEPSKVEIIQCPVEVAKAIKNPVEQQGFRNAYLRDGRATVRWMSWLENAILKDQRKVGEWDAAQVLSRFRREEDYFAGLAYGDISASGPHAALPHYEPERGKDVLIDIDAPYVIDSGAHYYDGTIDTTRTLYLGKSPSDEVKRAYTRVLQAHMAVSRAVFPEGMSADWLNMLAKQPLYLNRLDFAHGLGHGVGSYLNVHEYMSSFPHGLSFQPGHVTTIEPGYYKEGEFGIRTESLVLCKEVEEDDKDESKRHRALSADKRKWYGFERITQVPIQTSMVEWKILSKPEIKWLNDHNSSVQEALMPLLQEDRDKDARDWLKKACKPKTIWPWTGVR